MTIGRKYIDNGSGKILARSATGGRGMFIMKGVTNILTDPSLGTGGGIALGSDAAQTAQSIDADAFLIQLLVVNRALIYNPDGCGVGVPQYRWGRVAAYAARTREPAGKNIYFDCFMPVVDYSGTGGETIASERVTITIPLAASAAAVLYTGTNFVVIARVFKENKNTTRGDAANLLPPAVYDVAPPSGRAWEDLYTLAAAYDSRFGVITTTTPHTLGFKAFCDAVLADLVAVLVVWQWSTIDDMNYSQDVASLVIDSITTSTPTADGTFTIVGRVVSAFTGLDVPDLFPFLSVKDNGSSPTYGFDAFHSNPIFSVVATQTSPGTWSFVCHIRKVGTWKIYCSLGWGVRATSATIVVSHGAPAQIGFGLPSPLGTNSGGPDGGDFICGDLVRSKHGMPGGKPQNPIYNAVSIPTSRLPAPYNVRALSYWTTQDPLKLFIYDAYQNLCLDATNVVTATFVARVDGSFYFECIPAAVTGTLIQDAVAGVATFDDLRLVGLGFQYNLTFSSPGLDPVYKDTFPSSVGNRFTAVMNFLPIVLQCPKRVKVSERFTVVAAMGDADGNILTDVTPLDFLWLFTGSPAIAPWGDANLQGDNNIGFNTLQEPVGGGKATFHGFIPKPGLFNLGLSTDFTHYGVGYSGAVFTNQISVFGLKVTVAGSGDEHHPFQKTARYPNNSAALQPSWDRPGVPPPMTSIENDPDHDGKLLIDDVSNSNAGLVTFTITPTRSNVGTGADDPGKKYRIKATFIDPELGEIVAFSDWIYSANNLSEHL